MSKAFTREDDSGAQPIVPARAPLPPGVPNYVTSRGLVQLREELGKLEDERGRAVAASREKGEREESGDDGRVSVAPPQLGDTAHRLTLLEGRITELAARVGSAMLVEPPGDEGADEVRFGATVTVAVPEAGARARRFTIVGVDEADASAGRVTFVSPMARALLGRRVGDVVTVRGGRGEEELEIREIVYQHS